MNYSQVFFIFAMMLMAPHLSEFESKKLSLGCLAVAVIFFAVELWLESKK